MEICNVSLPGGKTYSHPVELDLASLYDVERDFLNAFLIYFSLLISYDH